MTDKTSTAPEGIKDAPHSPIIFFETVSNFGIFDGVLNMTLVVSTHRLQSDGQVKADANVAAYLRFTPSAAIALRDAINSALLLGQKTEGQAN